MPVYSSPNLTQTANGADMYLRTEPPSGTDLIVGNLQVTGTITGAGTISGNGSIVSVNPATPNKSVQLLNSLGPSAFPAVVYQNGVAQSSVGLVSPTGPLLVGTDGTIPVSIGGALAPLLAGSLGATSPVVPAVFGTSAEAQWSANGQVTFVVAGYRFIAGTFVLAGLNGPTTINFTTPFAVGAKPVIICQPMTAGSPLVEGFINICQTGGGTGESPTNASFQCQGVQANGGSFPASSCFIAFGPA